MKKIKFIFILFSVMLIFAVITACSNGDDLTSENNLYIENSPSKASSLPEKSSSSIPFEESNEEDGTIASADISQVPFSYSSPSSNADVSIDECMEFQDYLEENLSGDDYAFMRMFTTGKTNCIWIVNSNEVETVISKYKGKKPLFNRIYTVYSLNNINQAIAEINSLEMVINNKKKIGSISCFEGFVDIALMEPFAELEEYLLNEYGNMVRINVMPVNTTD